MHLYAYYTYAMKELTLAFLFFSIFILRANAYVGYTYWSPAGQSVDRTPFSKGQIGDFPHLLNFFHPYSSLLLYSLELCEMQFAVYVLFHIWTMRFMNWKAPDFIAVLSHPYPQTGCRIGVHAQAYECKNQMTQGSWVHRGQMHCATPVMGCTPSSLLSHLQLPHHVVKEL